MEIKTYIPYVYFIKHIPTGLKYIGAEYGKSKKIANPDNLWTTYFTSSKLVKKLIGEYGANSFKIKILKQFDNPTDALMFEQKLLIISRAKSKYINICKSVGFDLRTCSAAGSVGGNIVKNRKIGIFNEEHRQSYYSLGGRNGAKMQIENKIGIHGQTKEERLSFASMGGKVGSFTMPHIQSANGKKGGKGNAGFRWVNDGSKSIKLPKRKFESVGIDVYINQNNLKLGKLK